MPSWGYCAASINIRRGESCVKITGSDPTYDWQLQRALDFICTPFGSRMLIISVFFWLLASPQRFRNRGLTVSAIRTCLSSSPMWHHCWRLAILNIGKLGSWCRCSSRIPIPIDPLPLGWYEHSKVSIIGIWVDPLHLWEVGGLVPASAVPCKSVTAPTQPWIPLHARIDQMVLATPFAVPPNIYSLHPVVSPSEDGLTILTNGLFPHCCLHQTIWVKDDRSLTKYGHYPLSWGELAMLWDVPTLFMDLFEKSLGYLVAVLERLLASLLGKFLELGTDHF